MAQYIGIITSFIFIGFSIYYLVKPDEITKKSPRINPKIVRILCVLLICLSLASLTIKVVSLTSTSQSSSHKSELSPSDKFNQLFQKAINKYDKSIQKDIFTAACIAPTIQAATATTPHLNDKNRSLAALASCSCITFKVKHTKEYKLAKSLLLEGRSASEAMASFTDVQAFVKLITPCSEQILK